MKKDVKNLMQEIDFLIKSIDAKCKIQNQNIKSLQEFTSSFKKTKTLQVKLYTNSKGKITTLENLPNGSIILNGEKLHSYTPKQPIKKFNSLLLQ
jgi:hypothetical protein